MIKPDHTGWKPDPEQQSTFKEEQQASKIEDSMDTNIKAEPENRSSRPTLPPIHEPPISSAELEEQKPKTFQLQALLNDAGPQTLEASVDQGVKLLDQLKVPLLAKVENNPDAEQWIEQIDNLRKQAVKTRTVIGVVGNTGSGKSR